VIGAKRLSELARSRGTGMREFKHSLDVEPATSDPPSPRHPRHTHGRVIRKRHTARRTQTAT